MRVWRVLMNPTPEGGGGGGNPVPTPASTPEPKADDKGVDLVKAVEGLVAKHGDTTAALRVLLGENYSYRDQIRDLKAKAPGDADVILKGDDAKHWSSYRALGAPTDLKKALDEGKQATTEVGAFRKAEVHRSAAELHGFKPSVLGTLARDLEITIGDRPGADGKPVLKDGKPVKAALVKGEGDKVTPLDDYAAEHWKDFLPSLAVQATTEKPRGTPRFEAPRQGQGGGNNNAGNGNGNNGQAAKRRPLSTF